MSAHREGELEPGPELRACFGGLHSAHRGPLTLMTAEDVTVRWGAPGTAAVAVGMGAGAGPSLGWKCGWPLTVGVAPGKGVADSPHAFQLSARRGRVRKGPEQHVGWLMSALPL